MAATLAIKKKEEKTERDLKQGGGGTTAYVASPHAPDGAPTVGTARIGGGAVLEGSAAT
jgi:hypothetical protein